MGSSEMSSLLTECDVAERLHVSLASIRRWRLEQRGPRYIKLGSLVRYRQEDVETWLSALPTGGSRSGSNGNVDETSRHVTPTATAAMR